jgi:phosphonate transport system ATP-binding protein
VNRETIITEFGTPATQASLPHPRPLLEVRDLTVYRGQHPAVQGVSFDLRAGEFVALMGRSGAGKTSLMHALSGLITPATGMVHWTDLCRDACCAHLPQPRRPERRAVMFQHYRLIPQLSALTNVLCGRLGEHRWTRTLWGFPAEEKLRAQRLLASVGLPDRSHLRARQLSGGEQQRVAVARTLIQEPTLLLADEPVASLDAETANEVMQLFQRLNRERGVTLLCVLHDLEMAERFAARVLLLEQGRLVYDGPSRNLQSIVEVHLSWKTLL